MAVLRDNKGIEARGLIYVLAAVALVASLSIAMQVIGKAGEMTGTANEEAKRNLDRYVTHDANYCESPDLIELGGPYGSTDDTICKTRCDTPDSLISCRQSSLDNQYYCCKSV